MEKGLTTIIILVTIAVFAVIFGILFWKNNLPIPGSQRVCTLEAKICPDGSSVGRSGPNCEFAACPTPTLSPSYRIMDLTPTQGANGWLDFQYKHRYLDSGEIILDYTISFPSNCEIKMDPDLQDRMIVCPGKFKIDLEDDGREYGGEQIHDKVKLGSQVWSRSRFKSEGKIFLTLYGFDSDKHGDAFFPVYYDGYTTQKEQDVEQIIKTYQGPDCDEVFCPAVPSPSTGV